ncbi:MAG: serine kinase [Anaerolineaceae bacterium]|nr:serine kinase [Anaerolineaceae bacterium]
MTLDQIIKTLNLKVLTNEMDFSKIVPTGGYTSDLLSCVMAGAKNKNVWVTLQSHSNIIAVASLLELPAIIITEGAMPDPATIEKANEENITLLSTSKPSYFVVGKLWELGVISD